MDNKGMFVIISGPSGTGKGTLVKKLVLDQKFALSISCTTRRKRIDETDGVDYFFCTEEEFLTKRNKNELLEYTEYAGNYYGTPRMYVDDRIEAGKIVILEIDVNGALQIKKKFSDAVLIFLLPPSIYELKRRLRARNTEDEQVIEARIKHASDEIALLDEYEYLVINDDIEQALRDVNTIIAAERLKPCRNRGLLESFNKGVEPYA